MTETLRTLLKYLLYLLPFLLFALLNMKANLKKPVRSRQFPMPVLALVYCILLMVYASKLGDLLLKILRELPSVIHGLAAKLATAAGGALAQAAQPLYTLAAELEAAIQNANLPFLILFVFNAAFMLAHILLKRLLITLMKLIFKPGNGLYEAAAGLFYEPDVDTGIWCVKPHLGQARTFLRVSYYAAIILSALAVLATCLLYRDQRMTALFYPVFGVILMGECYFLLDGVLKQELQQDLEAEEDEAKQVVNYALLRPVLRKLFGDKLGAEDTTISQQPEHIQTHEAFLEELETGDDDLADVYGVFMHRWFREHGELDRSYLVSGLDLLHGNSILFNNPFHYDLIPYVSYAMNHTLLRHKKVLIVLGRHGAEEDAARWAEEGFQAVTNVPELWRIGVLTQEPQELEVGIITRSSVHDLQLHEANSEFFDQVEFVILLEPSRLVTTAQVGLNSIVRCCRRASGKKLVFCSTDKNCDGLVDALSHILMTSISEVSATNRHSGTSSYMCWDTDNDHLQHRLLPNLSRYLGTGTELSFAALKKQVEHTDWYGGDAFPVTDTHWIAKQYYYDLLHYAELPAAQETMDDCFRVTADLWSAQVEKNHYMTVEDEACNMFEVRRTFSTRATEQGFVNVICPDYLMKDYMEQNNGLFNADPKAIPYIVADYAHTERNVVLRLCLRMSVGLVPAADVRQELMLIDAPTDDLQQSLWHQLCLHCCDKGSVTMDGEAELLNLTIGKTTAQFDCSVLRIKRKFNLKTGRMEDQFQITDHRFIQAMLGDLQSAGYIAEDEKGEGHYLGSELMGHVFQKYLPGQFFTFHGKYYEMRKITTGGQVLVRRAADHITGRPAYRQVRNYTISHVVDSAAMGDRLEIGGMKVTRQFADVTVQTPAYWQLPRYHDFAGGRKVTVNGIPERIYRNKQILRIDLPENGKFSDQVRSTLVSLFNELFRTLFAENQPYIAAVAPGASQLPSTYTLQAEGSARNCIYILEDSQLDLGLLVAVQRNLNRIFAILCDYLDWHLETLEASLNPPAEPAPPQYAPPVEEPEEEPEPKTWFGKLLRKIRNFFRKIGAFFKRIFGKIGSFFKKLFGRKSKDGEEPKEPVLTEPVTPAAEEPAEEGTAAGEPEEKPSVEEPAEEPEEEEQTSFSLFDAMYDASSDADKDTLEFEPEEVTKPGVAMERPPYHQRYYLLFGGKALPETIDPAATLQYLLALGYGDGELKQARNCSSIAEMIERDFVPNKAGTHYCDFCGCELTGTEYEILADGRERCTACGKTAVKTAEEFVRMYREILKNLDQFYGIRITAPVTVKMVNAKKLHRKLGKSFVPTGSQDGRILGVAIRDRSGYSILIENGSPRLKAVMTMVHELTHIWQYLNWDAKAIQRLYGSQELEIYEGMAKWSEIQYAYLLGETAAAKRAEIVTRLRDDEYGRGFNLYVAKYPLSIGTYLKYGTPFEHPEKPL